MNVRDCIVVDRWDLLDGEKVSSNRGKRRGKEEQRDSHVDLMLNPLSSSAPFPAGVSTRLPIFLFLSSPDGGLLEIDIPRRRSWRGRVLALSPVLGRRNARLDVALVILAAEGRVVRRAFRAKYVVGRLFGDGVEGGGLGVGGADR